MSRFSSVAAAAAVLILTGAPAGAQWFKLKTPNVPRTADGKLDTKAPSPRMSGKPDLSGLWRYDSSSYPNNVTVDLKPEEISPEVTALYKQRQEDLGKDDPSTFRCLPSGPRYTYAPQGWVRIVQSPTVIAMVYEDLTSRQIFMDGRPLPKDPNPNFMGYSVGRWDGDTLVVESIGFNDRTWLDFGGHPHTEALKTTERIKRTTFGRLDIEVELDDRALYTRPFTVPLHAEFVADTEMLEYVCNENQKDVEHLVGKASDEKKFAVNVAPAILSRYVGRYSTPNPGDPSQVIRFNVALSDGKLSVDMGGKDKQEMTPLSEKTFLVMGLRVDFVEDKGRTDHMIIHIVEGDMKATKEK
ncbi:MAG TPA: hypothetical protein VFP91_11645 [Vicinamibacterales bacterium]|nr:hypothetical protein [Vicinamibacterales bacterium]